MKNKILLSPSKRVFILKISEKRAEISYKNYVNPVFSTVMLVIAVFCGYLSYSFYLEHNNQNWSEFFRKKEIIGIFLLPIFWLAYFLGYRKIFIDNKFLKTSSTVFGFKLFESMASIYDINLEIKDKYCIRVNYTNNFFTIDGLLNEEDSKWLLNLLEDKIGNFKQ